LFRCQICNTVVPAGVRSTRIVVTTRPKVYAARGPSRPPARGPRRFLERPPPQDKGGEGREIIRELMVCPKCAAEREASLRVAAASAPENPSETPGAAVDEE
jgi:hypothetical protein